uniref:Fibronectin type-III domain-containing protein n=1 Tax=Gasterosteus aculeatus aculeatus TaxID=481459 RepID=G3PIK4_GASAC|nr:interleukin-20 receptor subunit alpha [Gasterosteus aculeatus aculeatus]
MWTVFFLLHLGAVRCTVSSSLPSPINVTFSSVNLWNELQWFPGGGTPEDARFKVEYAIYGDSVVTPGGRKVNWKAVRRCTGITRHGCDLSDETRDLEHEYLARVRATTRTGFSAWATTRRRFHPKADTAFGAPLVSVEVGDGGASVTLKGPMRHQPSNRTPAVSMATLYPQMMYMLSVENTRRGTTIHVPMNSNSYTYRLMEYDTEYCFSATTKFLSMPVQCRSSPPYCITTPADPVIGQLLRVVVGIVVPSVCMCTLAVVGYLLHNYLTGKGQKSPYILNPPAFHPPVLLFHPESPNLMVIPIIPPESAASDAECSKRPQHARHRPPGYASQGGEILPQPEGDPSVEYGCVVVAPEVPVGGEHGHNLNGEYRKRAAGDGYERQEWSVEEDHSAGRHEEVPLLSTGSTHTPSSVSDQSDLIPVDYGVLRPAPEHIDEEEEEEEEQERICINWNPETGRLVLPQMDGLMREEEEEEEEVVELRLENVFVRQGSEEKAEARREMEGGGGTGSEVEDFSTRWNLVVSMDE